MTEAAAAAAAAAAAVVEEDVEEGAWAVAALRTVSATLDTTSGGELCPPRISRCIQEGHDALQQLYMAVLQVRCCFPMEDAALAS